MVEDRLNIIPYFQNFFFVLNQLLFFFELIDLIKAKLEVPATLPPETKPIAHIDMSRGADSPVLVIRNPYDEYHDILVQFHGEVHTQAAKYVCDLINSAPRRP